MPSDLNIHIRQAYGYFSKGEPLPFDLYAEITAHGVNPEEVEELVDLGYTADELVSEYN